MLIRTQAQIASSEITPQGTYVRRREFLLSSAGAALAAGGIGGAMFGANDASAAPLQRVKGPFGTDEAQTPMQDATTYNNFYEFGLDKGDPARNSGSLQTQPWSVTIEGACDKPGVYQLEDILKDAKLEDRIYRMRCVEAWSMVIPWVGFPLGDLLKKAEPTSAAKYVSFETLLAPNQMPGQKSRVLEWPYREGLRIDEAMHPLTILAAGMYGETLPKQNGAPLRLVVPWKYGFKGIKSIVKIRFQETQPKTAWNISAPNEYGFYSNVNPDVDHPRWSQAKERRIGEFRKRDTLPFNGYAEQVASLYAGMDLKANF